MFLKKGFVPCKKKEDYYVSLNPKIDIHSFNDVKATPTVKLKSFLSKMIRNTYKTARCTYKCCIQGTIQLTHSLHE